MHTQQMLEPVLPLPRQAWRSRGLALELGTLLLHALLYVMVLVALVPFAPDLPSPPLDPSWSFGINEALARDMVFGRDIAFTHGPYGALRTFMYHPATDGLALGTALVFAAVLIAALSRLLHDQGPLPALLLTATLGFTLYEPDPLFLVFPLLVALLVVRAGGSASPPVRGDTALLAVAFMALALPPLVKGSYLFPSAGVVALGALYLGLRGRLPLALALPALSALSLVGLWALAGQPLAALPGYLGVQVELSFGYVEAMSLWSSGEEGRVLAAAGLAALLLLAVGLMRALSLSQRLFIMLVLTGTVLVLCKAAYVRSDIGHNLHGGTALVLCSILLLPLTRLRSAAGALLLLAVAGSLLLHTYTVTSNTAALERIAERTQSEETPDSALAGLRSLLAHEGVPGVLKAAFDVYAIPFRVEPALHGLSERLSEPGTLPRRYAERLERIAREKPMPRLEGTSDTYNFPQARLLASGNLWQPRPVFQGYSAYTPELAERNRQHLLGDRAPDNIFIDVASIDKRLPTLDDGPSWPVLLSHYRPDAEAPHPAERKDDDYLLLRRLAGPPAERVPQPLTGAQAQLGQSVMVPTGTEPLYLRLQLTHSLAGRLSGLFYKTRPLWLELSMADGQELRYRLPAAMARSWFLLSPLVRNPAEFALLYEAGNTGPARQVRSFKVVTSGRDWEWEPAFEVEFGQPAP